MLKYSLNEKLWEPQNNHLSRVHYLKKKKLMCYEIIEIELAESLPALSINFGQLEMIFDKISTLWQIGGWKKGGSSPSYDQRCWRERIFVLASVLVLDGFWFWIGSELCILLLDLIFCSGFQVFLVLVLFLVWGFPVIFWFWLKF